MKFSTIIISLGFAALAAAQANNSTRSVSVATPTQTSSYTTQIAACLGKCKESDVTCRAQCLGSAAPNEGAANATNECVGKCPKGDGSQSGTDQYAQCLNNCINKIFLSTSVAPAATGNSGSGSGSGSPSGAASATSGGGSASTRGGSANPTSGSNPSSTSSGSGSSSAPNAGSSVKVGGSFLALFGIAAGILAL